MAKAYARIDGLMAAEANIAALIRRGPSKWVRFYVWDFNNDRIVVGDWLEGRVYSRRGDISPDGRYLASYCGDAIIFTEPPNADPVAKWSVEGTWGGAGIWTDSHTFNAMPDPYEFEQRIPCPPEIKVVREPYLRNPETEIFRLRLLKSGWVEVLEPADPSDWWHKKKTVAGIETPWAARTIYMSKAFEGGKIEYRQNEGIELAVVIDTRGKIVLHLETTKNHPLWIDVDRSGRLVYADQGCLYAWAEFPEGRPQLIANLNDYVENPPPSR